MGDSPGAIRLFGTAAHSATLAPMQTLEINATQPRLDFTEVQHFIHYLAPTSVAGFVLANASMSSNQFVGGEIRKAINQRRREP